LYPGDRESLAKSDVLMITKDMEIEDLARDYPDAVGLLLKKGIVCIQCGAPIWGTLEEVGQRKKIATWTVWRRN